MPGRHASYLVCNPTCVIPQEGVCKIDDVCVFKPVVLIPIQFVSTIPDTRGPCARRNQSNFVWLGVKPEQMSHLVAHGMGWSWTGMYTDVSDVMYHPSDVDSWQPLWAKLCHSAVLLLYLISHVAGLPGSLDWDAVWLSLICDRLANRISSSSNLSRTKNMKKIHGVYHLYRSVVCHPYCEDWLCFANIQCMCNQFDPTNPYVHAIMCYKSTTKDFHAFWLKTRSDDSLCRYYSCIAFWYLTSNEAHQSGVSNVLKSTLRILWLLVLKCTNRCWPIALRSWPNFRTCV